MTAHQDANAGWTRLESLLTEMKPGDTVTVDALAAETGLTPAILLTVMKELERVELFTRQHPAGSQKNLSPLRGSRAFCDPTRGFRPGLTS